MKSYGPVSVTHYFKENLDINLKADEAQYKYVEEIMKPTKDTQAIFCDSPAGTGKTMLAIQAAYYLLDTGVIDKIIYARTPVAIKDQGFLPGELEEKEAYYMRPAKDALNRYSQNLFESLITQEKLECMTTSFSRGIDLEGNKLLIIDEAQNLNMLELRAMLTRPHDSVKVIIIGSSLQVDDLYAKKYGKNQLTAFQVYQHHFEKNKEIPTVNIKLITNYRGQFSQYADEIDKTLEKDFPPFYSLTEPIRFIEKDKQGNNVLKC